MRYINFRNNNNNNDDDDDGMMGRTMGQGDWADWPIVRPIGIVQSTAPSFPGI